MRTSSLWLVLIVTSTLGAVPGCGGDEPASPPAQTPLTGVVSIAAGGSHACAVLADGTGVCWGSGIWGELGNGAPVAKAPPTPVTGVSGLAAFAPGGSFTCALMTDGTVSCWGNESWGQTGHGTVRIDAQLEPGQVVGLTDVAAVVARGDDQDDGNHASEFACALDHQGKVTCWGQNSAGQLGAGPPDPSALNAVSTPGPVAGLTDATSLGLGDQHACAVLADGAVSCWGDNFAGQLGVTASLPIGTPVRVTGLAGPAVAVTGGNLHTCALLADGTVACWGGNTAGELGNGTTVDSATPVPVTGLAGIRGLSAGTHHTCAARADGTVWCWGSRILGSEGYLSSMPVPIQVTGVTDAVAVTSGEFFSCALRPDQTVKCWGDNGTGQLGPGVGSSGSRVPVTVTLAQGS